MLSAVGQLSNHELLARVKSLAQAEREATAVLIAHLAELDERCLYLAEGYSSLFMYCTQVLHLSEHAAYGRIEAARATRKFPLLLELLSEGSVTLTTVGLLAPHLTAENHQDLLGRARYQSKRAVEELIARLCPQPPVPAVVLRLPAPSHRPESPALLDAGRAGPPVPPPAPARRPATVAPLAPQRYRVQFTASAETDEKLRLAQDLLRHQIPDGKSGSDCPAGPDGAPGGSRQAEARRHGAPPEGSPDGSRLAAHPRGGEASGLGSATVGNAPSWGRRGAVAPRAASWSSTT